MFAHTTMPTAAATTSRQETRSPLFTKTVIVSGLLDGKWIEREYLLNDHNWRDALKLFCEIGQPVRLAYK
jgi:hypothetical protein